jgi:hypothetical protein
VSLTEKCEQTEFGVSRRKACSGGISRRPVGFQRRVSALFC